MGRHRRRDLRARGLLAVCAGACAGAAVLAAAPCALQPFRHVLVVGATHGNEPTGAWVTQRVERHPELASRPSLASVETVIGNPEAYRQNRRFVDLDLNRQFKSADLADVGLGGYEQQRAKVLDARFGAGAGRGEEAVDFVLDLHTSTASMGITYIVEQWSDVALACAAWCQRQLEPRVASGELPPVRIVQESLERPACPHLISMGREGLMVEVGPVPQGVLRHDVCAWTELATLTALDFLEAFNSGSLDLPQNAVVYRDQAAKVAAPIGPDGKPTAVFHRDFQGGDFEPLHTGDPMFLGLDGELHSYDGQHGPVIWPVFVNEGAYYLPESGLGFGVTLREEIDVPSIQTPVLDPSRPAPRVRATAGR